MDELLKLEEKKCFCEMLKMAHEGKSFYTDTENHKYDGGLIALGKEVPSLRPFRHNAPQS